MEHHKTSAGFKEVKDVYIDYKQFPKQILLLEGPSTLRSPIIPYFNNFLAMMRLRFDTMQTLDSKYTPEFKVRKNYL